MLPTLHNITWRPGPGTGLVDDDGEERAQRRPAERPDWRSVGGPAVLPARAGPLIAAIARTHNPCVEEAGRD